MFRLADESCSHFSCVHLLYRLRFVADGTSALQASWLLQALYSRLSLIADFQLHCRTQRHTFTAAGERAGRAARACRLRWWTGRRRASSPTSRRRLASTLSALAPPSPPRWLRSQVCQRARCTVILQSVPSLTNVGTGGSCAGKRSLLAQHASMEQYRPETASGANPVWPYAKVTHMRTTIRR